MKVLQTVGFALTAASVSASYLPQRNTSNSGKRFAILDNDWSATGFIPMLITQKSDIEILALTSSTSDSWQKQCAYHALATLEIGNLSCIPVYEGATYPLINTYERFQAWEMIHGVLPWEGVFAHYNATAESLGSDPTADSSNANRVTASAFLEGYPNTTTAANKSAAAFMIEQVHKYPGQVSIYAAGALTNIALAVRLDDQFAALAKELIIMGGYLDANLIQATGTVNQADISSDINLMIDPESAKIAITASFPSITIAGNVANQVLSTQDFLDEIYQVQNPYTKLIYDHYGTIFPFWDETAAAIMVDPTLATNTSVVYLDVDTAYGSPNYGNIHVYQKALMPPNVREVNYVNSIDATRFKKMLKEAVQYPGTC
ncbi:inosine-uridine preferring nucleoside hydrolase [Venturia nashicola]|nr:inosine-uridine preferring nucleoside hydrolase [Venturia nashicola]